MAQIPTYEQWIKDTKSALHKRSETLKVVDEALEKQFMGKQLTFKGSTLVGMAQADKSRIVGFGSSG